MGTLLSSCDENNVIKLNYYLKVIIIVGYGRLLAGNGSLSVKFSRMKVSKSKNKINDMSITF